MTDLPELNKLSLQSGGTTAKHHTNNDSDSDIELDPNHDTILGFIETPTNPSYMLRTYFPSKLGGRPAWLNPVQLPSIDTIQCKYCHNVMTFILQLYAPLRHHTNTFHRTLYIFSCTQQQCIDQGSVVCLRSQSPRHNQYYSDTALPKLPDVSTLPKLNLIDTPHDNTHLCVLCGYRAQHQCSTCNNEYYCSIQHQTVDWRLGHYQLCCNDGSLINHTNTVDTTVPSLVSITHNDTIKTDKTELTSEQAEKLKQERKLHKKLFPALQLARQQYLIPQYEIINEHESDCIDDSNSDTTYEQQLYQQYQQKSTDDSKHDDSDMNDDSDSGSDDDDVDNMFSSHHTSRQAKDKQFNIFTKVIKQVPDQVIRYCIGSKPLYISTQNQLNSIPTCQHCKSECQFEFQILPQLLYYICKDVDKASVYHNMDWGTLIVYTCKNSCNVEGYASECVHVQQQVFNSK